ncbi:MAG: hypothetical protein ACI8XV_001673, partial [Arenicella sp.]
MLWVAELSTFNGFPIQLTTQNQRLAFWGFASLSHLSNDESLNTCFKF